MALQEPPLAAFGLAEASVSSSGELELDNLEDLHQTFSEVALVLGDRMDKGLGKLAITTRYSAAVLQCKGCHDVPVHLQPLAISLISKQTRDV